MNKIYYILLLIIAVGCTNSENKDTLIVTVYGENLYQNELEGEIPTGISSEDSAMMVNSFINRWIHSQVILHKAKTSLMAYQSSFDDLEKRVEGYRNSLLVYEFEKKYISQNLDTIVKYEEVEAFYKANKHEFKLNNDIVQISYVKFLSDSKNLKQVNKMFRKFTEEDIIRIKHIAEIEAENYLLDADTWIVFDELIKEIPINLKNRSQYLQKDKFIEISDSLYTYFLRINDYKVHDNYSPMSYEYDRIQKIIVNMRKMDMIDELHNDIFKQAQEEGKIKILN